MAPRLASLALAGLSLLPPMAQADGPDDYFLEDAIPAALQRYSSERQFFLPQVTSEELEDLVAGKVVVTVLGKGTTSDGSEISAMGVAGLAVIDAPRVLAWLALFGGSGKGSGRYTRATLHDLPDGGYVRYQHVNLPWPFKDRHWVIQAEKNAALARASDGLIWEHRWGLHDHGQSLVRPAFEQGEIPRLSDEQVRKSIYLPSNHGAWIMFELAPDKTLLAANLDAELGGRFPGAIARRFTKMQMRAGFRRVAELARHVHLHYDGEPLVHDGFGQPITRQDAINAATRWLGDGRVAVLD